jgi:NAD/NADP transhydrogenase alpha subunit
MQIGTSIFLLAVGAILRFAVNASTSGFSIHTAGTILMIVGVIGLLLALFMVSMRPGRATVVERERDVYPR